ncbi:hypothetical protein BBP40_004216 [Aspergillus hancockii]|nr:hypothetical protein BBP40_004216 [Aspergillus hancockii]
MKTSRVTPTPSVVNFIQQPLPPHSSTGAGHGGQPGALGMGQSLNWTDHASNIAPLIAEQHKETRYFVKALPKTGERVVVDPTQTITRIFLYFYFMINIGSLLGQISIVYAEKYVGFWLLWVLPTVMFIFRLVVLFLCRNSYQSPKDMKSLVQSLYLFMHAISAAIQQGLTSLSADPLLLWNYGFVTVLAFVGGNIFWMVHRKLDEQEDELNRLEESPYLGRGPQTQNEKGRFRTIVGSYDLIFTERYRDPVSILV